ncbi:MAG TPA: DUF4340 domain-containing protein [Chthoniobacterales bacterium]|nr:DUF4340 domain-containing protein [Chthoniobacterales bacterium]
MKISTTLALLVIAIGLAIFVWILDRRSPGNRERLAHNAYLVDLDRNDVTQLEIENGDTKTRLLKTNDGWRLTAPVADRADSKVIDTLLYSTQFLKRDDTVGNLGKGDQKRNYLKQFGVLRSRLILRCIGERTHVELQFGGETAVEGACYVRIDSKDTVFVTDDDLKNLISKPPDSFRDHQLAPFLTPEIDRIVLTQAAGEIELTRQQDQWQIERPIKARASQAAVTRMLKKISETPVLQFQDEEGGGEIETENSPSAITLFSGQSKVKIACGAPVSNQPGHIYVRVSDRPSTFIVDESLAQTLEQKPNDLRDRKIMRLNPDLVDRITITTKGQPTAQLSRKERRWLISDQNDAPADDEAVDRLINALNSSDVSRFVSDSASDLTNYGLDTPALEFAFSSYSSENTAEESAGETRIATLAVGRQEDENYYARVEEEPYIVALPKRMVDELPTNDFNFRSHEILNLPRSDLASVEITKNGSTAILTRNPKGQWVVQGQDASQNDLAIQTFLNTLSGLQSSVWVSEKSLAAEPPVESIVIHRKSDQKEIVLQIGEKAAQGDEYATISTLPGTFLIRALDFQNLQDSLVR